MLVFFGALFALAIASSLAWVAKSLRADVILLNADASKRQLRDWFDGAPLEVTSVVAAYHRAGPTPEPAYFYRFSMTPRDLVTMTARLNLEARPASVAPCDVEPLYDEIAAWWVPPSSDRLRCYAGESGGRVFALLADGGSPEALLYVGNR